MGVAPILAPSIGNAVLKLSGWEGLFGAMVVLGIVSFLFTLFFLPETYKKTERMGSTNVFRNYLEILKNRKFVVYALLAGIVNGALMIYVANGPFLIMEKGGFSGNIFSIIFSVNAFGLMVSSYLTSVLQKHVATTKLVKLALCAMSVASLMMLVLMHFNISIVVILAILFFYVFPIGILFPTTTELALSPFAGTSSSGTASALFGSIQLAMAFICTLVSGFISNGTLVSVGISFFLCSMLAFIIVFSRINLKEKYIEESYH